MKLIDNGYDVFGIGTGPLTILLRKMRSLKFMIFG